MSDLIRREDAIEAIHNYWKKRLETLPTKESEHGEVYADIQQIDKMLEHNKILCNFIEAIPSADRPQGDYNRGYCDAVQGIADEMVKQGKYIVQDRPQGEWIPCSERLPDDMTYVLTTIHIPGREPVIRSGFYENGLFHNDNGDVWKAADKEVVAWQRSPEPYEAS